MKRNREILKFLSRHIRILNLFYRLYVVFSYLITPIKEAFIWLFHSKEYTNFTYELDNVNKLYLASFVSQVTGAKLDKIEGYIKELECDNDLRSHINKIILSSSSKWSADPEARYGRRLGWYALVRAVKPKIIVETGTDKGLGSCVFATALMKNSEEGFPGFLYSTDINTDAGILFQEPYNSFGKILFGDSIESLKTLNEVIDVFIHDSNHSSEYEMMEYKTISNKLSDKALILSDNAHVSSKLWEFARNTKRDFLFFQEKPKNHWYPGGGIGFAFRNEEHSITEKTENSNG